MVVKAMPRPESFSRKMADSSVDFGKRHWVTGVISLVLSSIIPIVTQWHTDTVAEAARNDDDRRITNAIEAVKNDYIREMASQKVDFDRQIDAIWHRVNGGWTDSTTAKPK